MAIKIQKEEGGTIDLTLNNGHVEALKKITETYKIKSVEDTIGFMLSVFVNGEGKSIEVNGHSFVPSQKILKDQNG